MDVCLDLKQDRETVNFGIAGFSATLKKPGVLSWGLKRMLTTSPEVWWSPGESGCPLPGEVTWALWWQCVAMSDDSFMSTSVTVRLSSWMAPNASFECHETSCAVFCVAQEQQWEGLCQFPVSGCVWGRGCVCSGAAVLSQGEKIPGLIWREKELQTQCPLKRGASFLLILSIEMGIWEKTVPFPALQQGCLQSSQSSSISSALGSLSLFLGLQGSCSY